MKIGLVSLFVLPAMFVAQQTSLPTSVPVEDEPLHKVLFKNDSVMVLKLTLPPGQRTQFHTHTHDRVAIDLSTTEITQQKINEPEGPKTETKPGNFSALTLTDASYTHRVHNVGKAPYEVLDIELLQRPETPSTALAATVAAENPSARIYNWVLPPGVTSPMHAHARPYVIVSITEINLSMTSPDGQSATHGVGPGDFRFVDAKVTHNLGNVGMTPGQIIEVELK
jgi:quercetin dioxygenase-like cupin family protein